MQEDQSPRAPVIPEDSEATETGLIGNRYQPIRPIGRGAAARVCLACDHILHRDVALKMLTEEAASDPGFVERFRREAKAIASFNHPNIVTVYDWGETRDTYYMVMEYVSGGTLGDLMAGTGPMDEAEGLRIAERVTAALAAAHARDIVHRDIKPDNILLTEDREPKVADFGIAWAQGLTHLTLTNVICGTVSYISPEQARGAPVDGRSDLYSLGVVLYRMLTGQLPFQGSSMVDVAIRHVQEDPVPPRQIRPEISPAAERVVMRALAKRPEDRFSTAQEMGRALRRARENLSPPVITEQVPDRRPRRRQPVPQRLEREQVPLKTAAAPLGPRAETSHPLRWILALPLLLLILGGVALAAHPWSSSETSGGHVASGTQPVKHPTAKAKSGSTKRGSQAAPTSTARQPVTAPVAHATTPPRQSPATGAGTGTGSGASTQGNGSPSSSGTSGQQTGNPTGSGASTQGSGNSSTGPARTVPTTAPPFVSAPSSGVSPSTGSSGTSGTVAQASAQGPQQAVLHFYQAVGEHRFADAAALWSPAMLNRWGRAQGIDQRFANTRSIWVDSSSVTAMDPASGTATVAIHLTEQTGSGIMQWAGSWQLIQSNGTWLLNSPALTQVTSSSEQSMFTPLSTADGKADKPKKAHGNPGKHKGHSDHGEGKD